MADVDTWASQKLSTTPNSSRKVVPFILKSKQKETSFHTFPQTVKEMNHISSHSCCSSGRDTLCAKPNAPNFSISAKKGWAKPSPEDEYRKQVQPPQRLQRRNYPKQRHNSKTKIRVRARKPPSCGNSVKFIAGYVTNSELLIGTQIMISGLSSAFMKE